MGTKKVPMYLAMLYPWPHCINVALWWPAFVTLCIAVERFIAGAWPIWFKKHWMFSAKPKFIVGIYVVMGMMLVPGKAPVWVT